MRITILCGFSDTSLCEHGVPSNTILISFDKYFNMTVIFCSACTNCQNKTMVDRDYMFRNGLAFEYSGGEYRKLVDVLEKRYPLWAFSCTGQQISLLNRVYR